MNFSNELQSSIETTTLDKAIECIHGLMEQNKELAQRNAGLQIENAMPRIRYEELIREYCKHVDELSAENNRLKAELESGKEAQLRKDLRRELNEQDETIAKLKAELERALQRERNLEMAVEKQESENGKHILKNRKPGDTWDPTKAKLDAKNDEIEQLRVLLEKQDWQLVELRNALANKNNECKALKNELDIKDAKILELEKVIERSDKLIDKAHDEAMKDAASAFIKYLDSIEKIGERYNYSLLANVNLGALSRLKIVAENGEMYEFDRFVRKINSEYMSYKYNDTGNANGEGERICESFNSRANKSKKE